MTGPICQSCNFGPGTRTGTINLVEMTSTVGDWHEGDWHALCDDCLSKGDPKTYRIIQHGTENR